MLYVTEVDDKFNENNKKVTVKINKILWEKYFVKVSNKEKIKLLKVLDSKISIPCAFKKLGSL